MTDAPLPPGARLAGYFRDSGGPAQERSAEQQIAEARARCRQHGWILLPDHLYVDSASGGTDARDAFLAMIRTLRRLAPERGPRAPDAPDGVLYWDLKRFSRSQDDGAYYRADLRRRGYVLVSLSDTIPPGDLAPVFEALLSWKAEQDLRDLSKDVKRGKRALLLARDDAGRYLHLWPGKSPTGFRREPVEWGSRRDGRPRIVGRIIPDSPGAYERVQTAFRMRAQGHTYPEIHDTVNLFAHLTDYRRLFKRPLYIGRLEHGAGDGRLVVEDWIEPAIDRETWDQVQALHQRNKKRHARGLRGGRAGTTGFALTGFLRCENGHPMCGSGRAHTLASGERIRYRYYVCSAYKGRRVCKSGGVNADHLERAVYDALATEALTPARVHALLAQVEHGAAPEDLGRHIARQQKAIQDLDRTIGRLIAAIEAGGHIPDLVEALASRQAERDRDRRALAAAERELRARQKPPPGDALIADFCRHIGQVLGKGDVPAVRRLLEALGVRIQMHEDRQSGVITYTLPAELGGISSSISFCL